MTLARFLQIVAACSILLGMGSVVWHYEMVHLPDFAAVKAEALYDKCMRECYEVCERNGIPPLPEMCNCDHCKRYLEGDS